MASWNTRLGCLLAFSFASSMACSASKEDTNTTALETISRAETKDVTSVNRTWDYYYYRSHLGTSNLANGGFILSPGSWSNEPPQAFPFSIPSTEWLGMEHIGRHPPIPVAVRQGGTPLDLLGLFYGGKWFVDSNINGILDAEDVRYDYGYADHQPVSGNWSGTGVGVFKDGVWHLDTNANGQADAQDTTYYFGSPGETGIVGDWNGDGRSKIGTVTPNLEWFLDVNGNGIWDGPPTDAQFVLGIRGDRPVVFYEGGAEMLGVYRQGGQWFIDRNGDRNLNESVINFGGGAHPVVGSWALMKDSYNALQCDAPYFPPQPPPPQGVFLPRYEEQKCRLRANQAVAHPFGVALPTSTNPNWIWTGESEFRSYDTEYEFEIDYECSSKCADSFWLAAGYNQSRIERGLRRITLSGREVGIYDGGATNKDYVFGVSHEGDRFNHLYTRLLLRMPTDGTISQWAQEAKDMADLLSGAMNTYELATTLKGQSDFTEEQLNVSIEEMDITIAMYEIGSPTETERERETREATLLEWKAVRRSLVALRDGQPLPVPPAGRDRYLENLVTEARKKLDLRRVRASQYLSHLDSIEHSLWQQAQRSSAAVRAKLEARSAKVAASKMGIEQAIARAAK